MSSGPVIDPRTPILVGCGQITDLTGKPSGARSNVAFCAEAAGLALADTAAAIGAAALGRKIDAVAVLEFFPDVSPRFASPFGSGDRFVAMAGNDPALLADMSTREQLGRRVNVGERSGRNVFQPV